MLPSNDCYAMTRRREGCKLVAYLDIGGVPTIGYGHTRGVKIGDTCTQEQADLWLIDDINLVSREVQEHIHVPITQHELDAIVDFAYNVGVSAFVNSTLLKLINQGRFAEAADQFPRWDHVHGKVVPGLLSRREEEEEIFKEV